MKKSIPLILLLMFSFCSKKREHNLPRLIVSEQKNLIKVNSMEMIELDDYSFFIANVKNGIDVDAHFEKRQENLIERIGFLNKLPKFNINVIVDSTYTFPAKGFKYNIIPIPKNGIVDGLINGKIPTQDQEKEAEKEMKKYYSKDNGWNNYVECYSLLILNKSKDSILTKFKYIQEAKDKNGKWKPIECYYNFGACGNPEQYYYKLLPNNYMIYPIIKYHGKFKTKLRVKLYNKGSVYYSNEFKGSVNYSQFDSTSLRRKFNTQNPALDFDEYSKIFFFNE